MKEKPAPQIYTWRGLQRSRNDLHQETALQKLASKGKKNLNTAIRHNHWESVVTMNHSYFFFLLHTIYLSYYTIYHRRTYACVYMSIIKCRNRCGTSSMQRPSEGHFLDRNIIQMETLDCAARRHRDFSYYICKFIQCP